MARPMEAPPTNTTSVSANRLNSRATKATFSVASAIVVRPPSPRESRPQFSQSKAALAHAAVAKSIDQGEHLMDGRVTPSGFGHTARS